MVEHTTTTHSSDSCTDAVYMYTRIVPISQANSHKTHDSPTASMMKMVVVEFNMTLLAFDRSVTRTCTRNISVPSYNLLLFRLLFAVIRCSVYSVNPSGRLTVRATDVKSALAVSMYTYEFQAITLSKTPHVHVHGTMQLSGRALCLECRVSWVRVPPEVLVLPRQLTFLRKNDCLGCAVLLCLVVW